MPFSVSVAATRFKRFGANQRDRYQVRSTSRTWLSLMRNGSRLCGVIASRISSCVTMAGDPQKSQRSATLPFTKTEMA